jgi:hypothetical protein
MMRKLFPRLDSVASIQIYTFWTTIVLTTVIGLIILI